MPQGQITIAIAILERGAERQDISAVKEKIKGVEGDIEGSEEEAEGE